MYHLKISGEITSNGYYGFSPEHLETHLEIADGEDILIDINSVGGCMNSGLSIYAKIKRYAKENNATITTRSDGFVASIATAIFLAGDKRIVNEFMQPFVHEPRFSYSTSETADDFRKDYMDLEQSRNILAEFYSKNTNLSKEEAISLMENDTWITAGRCLEIGFATEIEKLSQADNKIVASIKSNLKINKNDYKMKKSEIEKEVKASFFDKIISAFGGEVKDNLKNELSIKTADQAEIVFSEIDDLTELEVGLTATIDGETAEGTHIIEVQDEKKELVFSDGQLIDIKTVEVEDNEEDEESIEDKIDAKLKAIESKFNKKIKSLEKENKTLKEKNSQTDKFFNKLKGISSEFDEKLKKAKKVKETEEPEEEQSIFGEVLSKYNKN